MVTDHTDLGQGVMLGLVNTQHQAMSCISLAGRGHLRNADLRRISLIWQTIPLTAPWLSSTSALEPPL